MSQYFQCKLEKKTVKKVKPETWCEKMSQNVCAPSNCVISVGEKVSKREVLNVYFDFLENFELFQLE